MRRLNVRLALLICAAIGFSLVSSVGCSGCIGGSGSTNIVAGGARVNGLGSSFMFPAMNKLAKEFNTAMNAQIDYVSQGSGAGIQQMTDKTIDFGGTDAPMKKDQLKKANDAGGAVVHVPLVMGAVVAAYNLPNVEKPVNFTGAILADIYLGKIKKWNDPALKAANEGVSLPDLDITPVFRSDGSGTSNIWSEYLSKVSPEFKKTVGASTQPSFPQGLGVGHAGSSAVTGHVSRNPGSICYVEIAYAHQSKLKYGAIKNKAGKFVEAKPDAVTAAADAALKVKPTDPPYSLHDLTYSLTDADGETSYPICGIAYLVFYKDMAAAKKKTFIDFLRWATHDGQKMTVELDYAPLPAELVKAIDAKLKEVE